MIIKLKNFRCWQDKTFEIPDNGVTLISGNSGKGKTSILQAIYYALYGEGKKIVRNGATSCKVEIIYKDLHIIRSNKPNKLIVNNIYEDNIAQEILYKEFGKNFNIISYIEQDSYKSIMYMSPCDRLNFLESFINENSDLDKIKSNLKLKIREFEDINIKCSGQVEMYNNILTTIKIPDTVYKPQEEHYNINYLKETLQSLYNDVDVLTKIQTKNIINKNKYDDTIKNIECIEYDISQLERELIDCKFVGDDEYQKLISNLKLLKNNSEYYSKKQEYDKLYKEYTAIKTNERLTNDQIKKSIKDELWKKYSHQECIDKLRILREQQIENKQYTDVYQKLLKLQSYKDEYESILPYTGILTKCPSCECSISIINKNTLILSSKYDESKVSRISEISKYYKEYQILSSKNLKYTANVDLDLNELENYFKNQSNLEDRMKELELNNPSPLLQNLFTKCSELKKYIHQLSIPDNTISHETLINLENTFKEQSEVKRLYNRIHLEIETKKSILRTLYNTLSCISIESDDNINVKLLDLNSRIQTIETDINHGINVNLHWEKYDEYSVKMSEYNIILFKLEELKKNLSYSEENIKNIYTLKNIITRSETICLENIINTLNIHAQNFLDLFFQETPISVKLVTYKEIKTGKTKTVKPQIDLQIVYKENETDFSSLSGGEKARISLAFTLALAEMYNSKILMLDESISSLDYETTTDVISTIKYYFTNKIVLCISHQANTGIFDSVIDI